MEEDTSGLEEERLALDRAPNLAALSALRACNLCLREHTRQPRVEDTPPTASSSQRCLSIVNEKENSSNLSSGPSENRLCHSKLQ